MCLKMARSLNLETGRPLPEGKTDVLTSYAGYKELLETNVKAANILSFVSHYLTSYAGYKELLETNVKAANILSFVSH